MNKLNGLTTHAKGAGPWARWRVWAVLASLIGTNLSTTTFAGQIHSTFGPGDSSSKDGLAISGALGSPSGRYQSIAAEFMTSTTVSVGKIELAAFMLPVSQYPGITNHFRVEILDDFHNRPGNTVLESFNVSFPPLFSNSILTIESRLMPTLNANEHYWLAVSPADSHSFGVWLYSPDMNHGVATFSSTGDTWPSRPGPGMTPAFRISDDFQPNHVPEPGTATLLLLGGCGIAVIRRRYRSSRRALCPA